MSVAHSLLYSVCLSICLTCIYRNCILVYLLAVRSCLFRQVVSCHTHRSSHSLPKCVYTRHPPACILPAHAHAYSIDTSTYLSIYLWIYIYVYNIDVCFAHSNSPSYSKCHIKFRNHLHESNSYCSTNRTQPAIARFDYG